MNVGGATVDVILKLLASIEEWEGLGERDLSDEEVALLRQFMEYATEDEAVDQ